MFFCVESLCVIFGIPEDLDRKSSIEATQRDTYIYIVLSPGLNIAENGGTHTLWKMDMFYKNMLLYVFFFARKNAFHEVIVFMAYFIRDMFQAGNFLCGHEETDQEDCMNYQVN